MEIFFTDLLNATGEHFLEVCFSQIENRLILVNLFLQFIPPRSRKNRLAPGNPFQFALGLRLWPRGSTAPGRSCPLQDGSFSLGGGGGGALESSLFNLAMMS